MTRDTFDRLMAFGWEPVEPAGLEGAPPSVLQLKQSVAIAIQYTIAGNEGEKHAQYELLLAELGLKIDTPKF
jgi:hypothetical protein